MPDPKVPKDVTVISDAGANDRATAPPKQAEEAIKSLLEALEIDDQDDPELRETPRRVAELFADWLRPQDLSALKPIPMNPSTSQVIVVRNVPFHAFCAHHLVPFFGDANIAYAPAGEIVGFGALPRLISEASRGPNLQERMASRIATHLDHAVSPAGVIVQLNARQMCVELTGHRCSPRTTTIAALGVYGDTPGRHAAELFSDIANAQTVGTERA